MTTAPLQGRVALVTGAGRRTGRSIALALAGAGADVLVHCHHSQTEAQQVVQEITSLGRRAKVGQADLGDVGGDMADTNAFDDGSAGRCLEFTAAIVLVQ
jgi:NAD(P)-dependent dehydrogenase (short-subunit alcohol dehydrogenase family)